MSIRKNLRAEVRAYRERRDPLASSGGATMGQGDRLACACRQCGDVIRTPTERGRNACSCGATIAVLGQNSRRVRGEFLFRVIRAVADFGMGEAA